MQIDSRYGFKVYSYNTQVETNNLYSMTLNSYSLSSVFGCEGLILLYVNQKYYFEYKSVRMKYFISLNSII